MVDRIKETGLEFLRFVNEHVWDIAVDNAITKPALIAYQLFIAFIVFQVALAFRACENI